MDLLHIVCPHCDAVNRVRPDRLDDRPVCGSCRQRLFTGQPLELNGATFRKHVERSDIPIVVDFWAPWCGPCRMMAPIFAQAAARLEPRLRLAKLNTEEEPGLAGQFGIQAIPTTAIFNGGREAARRSGAMDLGTLVNWIQSSL